jgi:hypothetical protein
VTDQAEFFSAPPTFYGTQFAGKEEAINGRFYEMLVAEGGEYLDKDGRPAFNSDAGVRALDWFVKLYKDKAVPAGTTNYLWDDLGQGFASGSIALNLDWPGWASFFNDPKSSKVAGNVGVKVQPAGSSGKRTGWSGHHGFSVTESCANKEAAASLVWWLTNEDSQKLESATGPLPTRSAVWDFNIKAAEGDAYKTEVLQAFQEAAKHAFPVPQTAEWIEISNSVYPELQAAILGDKTSKQALDSAAEKGHNHPAGCRQALIDLTRRHGFCRGAAFLSGANQRARHETIQIIGTGAAAVSGVPGSGGRRRRAAGAFLLFKLHTVPPDQAGIALRFHRLAQLYHVLSSWDFWVAFGRTVLFLTIALNAEMLLGLGLALLVSKAVRGQRLLRTVMMFPMMFSPVLVGFQFKFLFNDNIGLINNGCSRWADRSGDPVADRWQPGPVLDHRCRSLVIDLGLRHPDPGRAARHAA